MDLGRIHHLPEPRKTQPIGWHMAGANGMARWGLEFDDFQLSITLYVLEGIGSNEAPKIPA